MRSFHSYIKPSLVLNWEEVQLERKHLDIEYLKHLIIMGQ